MYIYFYIVILSLILNYSNSLENNSDFNNYYCFVIPTYPTIRKPIFVNLLNVFGIFTYNYTTESQIFNNGLYGKVSPRRGQRYRRFCISEIFRS